MQHLENTLCPCLSKECPVRNCSCSAHTKAELSFRRVHISKGMFLKAHCIVMHALVSYPKF